MSEQAFSPEQQAELIEYLIQQYPDKWKRRTWYYARLPLGSDCYIRKTRQVGTGVPFLHIRLTGTQSGTHFRANLTTKTIERIK